MRCSPPEIVEERLDDFANVRLESNITPWFLKKITCLDSGWHRCLIIIRIFIHNIHMS